MENKKDILVATGAGVFLVAAALLIFAVPALAGVPTTGAQGTSGCGATDAQGQVSCPMANSTTQGAIGDTNTTGGACH
ncbi:MAG: hypothetical protein C4542_00010 [Dehalococcoidia bacterium]|nr:MAG: hypothetical protein C4542_00010 [Dehalococcoidia bacterium]